MNQKGQENSQSTFWGSVEILAKIVFVLSLRSQSSLWSLCCPLRGHYCEYLQKIFDPLGFLSPCIISAKILFQRLCVDKVNWDDRLEGEALQKWNGLVHEFSVLANLQIPRCCLVKEQTVLSCKLHGFSDASERAYRAVVYLCQQGVSNIQFVTSRTRVCSLKKQSIPRLELLGATF